MPEPTPWEVCAAPLPDPCGRSAAAPGEVVLVVDDEPLVRRVTTRHLEREGYRVLGASNGQEALAVLEAHPVDLVVSDITMPDCDGIMLMEAMRGRGIDLPVILVTGVPSTESAVAAVRLGAVSYLGKPLRGDQLLSEVKRALHLHALACLRRDALRVVAGGQADAGQSEALHEKLDQALRQLFVVYQPIVSWAKRRVVGYEALVRSSAREMQGPQALFGAAERLGRVAELSHDIRTRSAASFQGHDDLLLFVNVHAVDLLDDALLDAHHPLTKIAERVVLEVTERAQLEDLRTAQRRIERLRERGFRIAIDDIGAGYAGLSSFALLEPDLVKLDQSLVRDVQHAPIKQQLIRSLTKLCGDLGINVIAEGIESAAEHESLLELGCDLFQGYHFSRPSPDLLPSVSLAHGT